MSEMSSRLRAGVWAAFAGLCLQLTGAAWDTLQHHNDPGLAARESVVSLTNPSHLLLALGVSIVALGIGWCLYWLGNPRFGPRPSLAATVAVIVLVTLWLGTTTVSLRTGGVSGRHDHQTAPAREP